MYLTDSVTGCDPARGGGSRGSRVPPVPRAVARDQTDRPRPVILVVDDERANLKLAEIVLKSEGFGVRTATDAISAFEILKDCDPALIVMDIQLPGMDGWELSRRLTHNAATSHIPVIALTAYGTKGDDLRARESGCVAYFAKPVSTRDLPDIIRRYLKVAPR
jgi:two-component system cell cycle response regulator DivK